MTTLATATAYDLRPIMQEAWEVARRFIERQGWTVAAAIARGLTCAWEKARTARRVAQSVARAMAERAQRVEQTAALGVETVSRLLTAELVNTGEGTRATELREALTIAKARAVEAKRADVRGAILGEGGKLVAVTFTKRDGTLRTMKVQPPALRSRVKGEAATEAGQRAVATRKANHPELMPVWDVDAGGVRSINLDTVSRVASGGTVRTFDPAA